MSFREAAFATLRVGQLTFVPMDRRFFFIPGLAGVYRRRLDQLQLHSAPEAQRSGASLRAGKNSYISGIIAIVSEKGQITIPKEQRERLGLKTGTVLQFDTGEGKLLAWKQVEEDVFEKWRGRGKLPAGNTADEYLGGIRDDHRR